MEKEVLIDLVQRSQGGDMEAFEKLLLHAHTSVSYQCRKMLKNEQDAEDMTQEVLVTVYQKLDTLKEPAAFHKWLHQITASRCINALTRTHVEFQIAEDEEGHSVLDTLEEVDDKKIPEKWLDTKETTRMIEEIVDGLPEVQRMCTLMFYYSELSVKEISRIMKVSENTIKSRLNYARKAIKEKVLDYEKKGVKLYGLSPLPFLYYFLHKCQDASKDPAGAQIMVDEIVSQGAFVETGAVSAASSAATGTSGTAVEATAATGTAATASGTTGLFGTLTTKIIAGFTAALVTVGGVAVATTMGDDSRLEPLAPTIIQEEQGNGSEPKDVLFLEAIEETTEPTTGETKPIETTIQHTHSYSSTVTAATCLDEGYTTYTCKTCSYSYKGNYTDKIEHTMVETGPKAPTCIIGGVHMSYRCSKCGFENFDYAIPPTGHSWGEWVRTKEPTTSAIGVDTRTCSVCKETETRSVDKLPETHTHKYTSKVTAPTCYEQGYTTYTCMTCGYSYTDNYTPQLEHTMVETGPKEATCITYGVHMTYHCSKCGFANFDYITDEPTGHSYISSIIPPTEMEQGYTEHTCTACGDSYRDSYTDALGVEE